MSIQLRLALALFAVACAFGQTDIYKPYRYADKWTADTLYVGASFRYTGSGPLTLTLQWSETSVPGDLYIISPANGNALFVMTNHDPIGTKVDLNSLAPFKAGDEIVFQYVPHDPFFNAAPRFTGPSMRGSRFFNTTNSNANPNPNLRFGGRYSVAGQIKPGLLEFGIEDTNGSIGDMDFNDIHFTLQNAQLLLYQNMAKKRSYVW